MPARALRSRDGIVAVARDRAREQLAAQATRRRWVRRAGELASPAQRDVRAVRRRLARAYLAGSGLEIGALHLPLPVPRHAHVAYVDRMTSQELRREYPELRSYDLVDVDVVDDGQTLVTVPDASVDFVVANHFIEHTEDPIAALANHARVLRPGGVLFLAVPDKRRTFDASRPVTPLEHVVHDHTAGPAGSRRGHYEEWATLVEGLQGTPATERAAALDRDDFSIHFHVWTPHAFAELLLHCAAVEGLPLELETLQPVRHEFIAVLRRPDGGSGDGRMDRRAATALAARRFGERAG